MGKPAMKRAAKGGARSSLHYGDEGILIHPPHQGVCGQHGTGEQAESLGGTGVSGPISESEVASEIPTVADRTAQQVVKARLEPELEPLFHADSYGYRPGKSALDAVGQARARCWCNDWVLDLDIKGFFDNLDQNLLLRAVRKHAKDRWVVLYIERWLKAPLQEEDGRLTPRAKGTPQGGVISPLLANLFLHYGAP